MSVLFLTRVDGGRIISARDAACGISRTRRTCRRVLLPLLFLDLHVDRFRALHNNFNSLRTSLRCASPVRCVVWSVVIYVDFAVGPSVVSGSSPRLDVVRSAVCFGPSQSLVEWLFST